MSKITEAEAKAAGTKNLDKFPRNMLFARAMSNGTKWYTPDVFNGNLVYTPDEMGAKVNIDGEFIEGEVADDKPAPKPPKKEPAKAKSPTIEEIEAEPATKYDGPPITDDDMTDESISNGLDAAFADDDEKDTSGKASKEQVAEVKAKFKEQGIDSFEAKTDFCKEHIGKGMPSTAMDYNRLIVALDEAK